MSRIEDLRKEYKELQTKVVKLRDFMVTDEFSKISYYHRNLLEEQLQSMQHYLQILVRRIIDLISNDHPMSEEMAKGSLCPN